MNNGGYGPRRTRPEDGPADDDDEDDDEVDGDGGAGLEAWERAYADERSWESLQEDESGLLRPIDTKALHHAQYRRRLRSTASANARIQKGLIRYLYVVIDLSRVKLGYYASSVFFLGIEFFVSSIIVKLAELQASLDCLLLGHVIIGRLLLVLLGVTPRELLQAASEMDFRPSRMAVLARHAEAFIREFFDQNPLSQIGLVTIKDGVALSLTDLGGSPEFHIKALMGKLECSGDSSLQNALELVHGYLDKIPSYGHREVLILTSALSTCDPGDIMETIQKCKSAKIRCSVIGLSAEVFICKHICQETGGTYTVALDESHFKELIIEHAPPPPAIAEFASANLIKMGFPQRSAENVILICVCHKEAKSGGYTCPRCKARVCELPTECHICGLTLVSSPHLARSYHHLFPIAPFDELGFSRPSNPQQKMPRSCFGCRQSLLGPGIWLPVRKLIYFFFDSIYLATVVFEIFMYLLCCFLNALINSTR